MICNCTENRDLSWWQFFHINSYTPSDDKVGTATTLGFQCCWLSKWLFIPGLAMPKVAFGLSYRHELPFSDTHRLQQILLKIALVVGVEIHSPLTFMKLMEPTNKLMGKSKHPCVTPYKQTLLSVECRIYPYTTGLSTSTGATIRLIQYHWSNPEEYG